MRNCEFRDLGKRSYVEALAIQKDLADRRKRGEIPNQLLIVEHPHVITLGRNGHLENLLASSHVLERTGISFHQTDRGGDITYHGPGQIVGYPIFDLRDWKRDVVAYVRAVEEVIMGALAEFDIHGTPRARRNRSLGERRQNRSHRDSHQPLGHLSRFRVEPYNGPQLFSVHRALRTH